MSLLPVEKTPLIPTTTAARWATLIKPRHDGVKKK